MSKTLRHKRLSIGAALKHTILILGAFTMVAPFIWMMLSSLMTNAEMFYFPPKWLPSEPMWQNYVETVNTMPFLLFTWNTTFIAVTGTFGMLLVSSVAAYAFARMRFPGRTVVFSVLMACMMIPGQVTMIPTFLIMRKLGWVNTFLPLIVPMFFGSAYCIFMMRQFYATIPLELEDSAKIDGCGRLRIIFQILVPLSKPALATLGVFTFMGKWNDLLGPVIYLNDYNKMTLPVGLAMFKGQYLTKYNLLMCGAVITILPILVIYLFTQRYFTQGIVMTGLKG